MHERARECASVSVMSVRETMCVCVCVSVSVKCECELCE